MQPLQRSVARSTSRLRAPVLRQQRRRASDSHGSDSHGGSHDAHHSGPTNESFGTGFYVALAAIPASLAAYKFSQQGADGQPYLTRLIRDTYDDYHTKWADRNDLHTRAVEQAAADRVLFLTETNRSIRHVDLRFPEAFNSGSPWNVSAGNGAANLDQLIAKYEKEAYESNAKKLQQLSENKVPAEQPYTSSVVRA